MVIVIVAELVEQGFLQKIKHMGSQAYLAVNKKEKLNLDRYKNQYRAKTHELNKMLNYGIQTERCRMELLRLALGDQQVQVCGHCDICSSVAAEADDHVENIENINNWLTQKTVRTAPVTTNKISSGVAMFDGKLRTPLFLKFMRDRTKNEEIDAELLLLIQKHVDELAEEQAIGCVIPIPSRTWNLRDNFTKQIAQEIRVPVFLNYLSWRDIPAARQGELLNNDQRRYNVDQRMTADFQQALPGGAILLLDDYIGSGATLQEAARVLRKESHAKQAIIPFTIASIKWRLGKAGMV
jgi:ATP-dependent DNA helicase RecQ